MQFNKVIRQFLKEDKDREKAIVVDGSFVYGENKLYSNANLVPVQTIPTKTILGFSTATIALELMEETIKNYDNDVHKGHPKPRLEDCDFICIYVDDTTTPKDCFKIKFEWTYIDKNNRDTLVRYNYRGVSADINTGGRFLHNLFPGIYENELTLDQLKAITQKEITDISMKGHDFEDLYNL